MSHFVYFEYRGTFPQTITSPQAPSDYWYVVEASKRDIDGEQRGPEELRGTSRTILHNGLSEGFAEVLMNSQAPREIEQARFDKMVTTEVYSTWDGTIYQVVRDAT